MRFSIGERIGWLRLSVAAVSLLLVVVSGYIWVTYQNFSSSVAHGNSVPSGSDADGESQNILLLGNDSRAGATAAERAALHVGPDDGEVNTDTMMVMHIPANGGAPTVVSFPRDSWVRIPDNGMGKLNAAYGDGYVAAKRAGKGEIAAQAGGIDMTIRTLEGLTGLHIDHYVQVNLLGFYRIANALGGVTICLNAAQNASTDRDAYGKGYSGINLPKGVSVIKGTQALAFVRQRHGLPQGDLDRIKRQQYFLSAAFDKVTSSGTLLNPGKLHALLKAVGSSLLVDPKLDLISLAQQMQKLAAGKMRFETIPNDGPQMIYPNGVGTSIVRVDTAAMPGFVRELDGKPADPKLAAAKAAAPSAVTVDVLNGSQTNGLAGQTSTKLRALGFHTGRVANSPSVSKTTIQYPNGMQAEAKAVAGAISGVRLTETSAVKRVTVVLGTDGVEFHGQTSTHARSLAPTTHAATTPADPANAQIMRETHGLGCIN